MAKKICVKHAPVLWKLPPGSEPHISPVKANLTASLQVAVGGNAPLPCRGAGKAVTGVNSPKDYFKGQNVELLIGSNAKVKTSILVNWGRIFEGGKLKHCQKKKN